MPKSESPIDDEVASLKSRDIRASITDTAPRRPRTRKITSFFPRSTVESALDIENRLSRVAELTDRGDAGLEELPALSRYHARRVPDHRNHAAPFAGAKTFMRFELEPPGTVPTTRSTEHAKSE